MLIGDIPDNGKQACVETAQDFESDLMKFPNVVCIQ